MFCRNCGYNMGDAMQCPKCGMFIPEYEEAQSGDQQAVQNDLNQQGQQIKDGYTLGQYQDMLNSSISDQASNINANMNNQYMSGQNADEQSQNAGYKNINVQNQADAFGPHNNFYQNYQNGMQKNNTSQYPSGKKKKRWPVVVAIVAVICLIFGAGTFFAFPYIQDAMSPKKQAVTALKNSCSNLQSKVSTTLDKGTNNATDTKKKLSGEFTLDRGMFDGSDYLTYLKVDTLAYEMDVDTLTQEMSGTINMKNGSKGTSQLEISFYADGTTLYIRIPQLFNETLEVSMSDIFYGTNYQSSYSGLATMLGGLDNLTITKYSGAINAFVKDAVSGLDVMIDNCEYKKTDSINMDSVKGSEKVSVYNVTITPNAICKGMEEMVDKMYDDPELSAYMTLLSTYSSTSKQEIKDSIWSAYPDMSSTQVTIYVTKDNKIVRFFLDNTSMGEGLSASFDISCVDNNKITDVYTMELRMSYEETDITKSSSGMGKSFNKYQSSKTKGKEHLTTSTFVYRISWKKDHVTLDEFSMSGNSDGEQVDFSMSGSYDVSDSTSLKLPKSNFVNPVNVESMTQEQAASLYNQLNQNSYIIRNIISDSLYNALMR